MSAPLRDWGWSAVTVDIGARLLAAEPDEPLRVEQIASELQQPERSVRELLRRLSSGRLVARAQLQTGEPGRPAWGYWLTDEERPAAERAVDTPEVLRKFRRKRAAEPDHDETAASGAAAIGDNSSADTHAVEDEPTSAGAASTSPLSDVEREAVREVVIVNVSGQAYAHLLEALSGTRSADTATWAIRVGEEIVFAFGSDDATAAAGDLVAVLAGARLCVRSASVRELIPAADLIARAQRMAPEIRRARSTRDAYDAPQ